MSPQNAHEPLPTIFRPKCTRLQTQKIFRRWHPRVLANAPVFGRRL